MTDQICRILTEQGRLPVEASALPEDAGLDTPVDRPLRAGMTSPASGNVILACEDVLAAEFPDHLITRSATESISSIAASLSELGAATPT